MAVASNASEVKCNAQFSDDFLLYLLSQTESDNDANDLDQLKIDIKDDKIFKSLNKKEQRYISKNLVCIDIFSSFFQLS